MIDEEKLTGWLCFVLFQKDAVIIPPGVSAALEERGWCRMCEDPSHGHPGPTLEATDVGVSRADLSAPEWGIELDFSDSN